MKKQKGRGASMNMLKSFKVHRNPTKWLNRNQFGTTSLFVSVRHRPGTANSNSDAPSRITTTEEVVKIEKEGIFEL